jgi:phage baseplate assembly protein W
MAERFLYQPFRLGRQGGVAVTDDASRHLRDKVLAVLFTAPGERLNRPDFGVGLNRAVFEPLNDIAIASIEFQVTQELNRELGSDVIFDRVEFAVAPERGELELSIEYRRRSDRVRRRLEVRL